MVVEYFNSIPYAKSIHFLIEILHLFSFLEFSGTNVKDKKLFKVICTDACKDIKIRLDAADGDPDLCARYYQIHLFYIIFPSV